MTPAEIDAIEAGPDLDRLVAAACGIAVHDDIVQRLGSIPIHYWRPSTDWNDAMLAAEKAGVFDGCALEHSPYGEWEFRENDVGGHSLIASHKSGPVAICRAILKVGFNAEDALMSLWPTCNFASTPNKAVDVKEAIRSVLRKLKLKPPSPPPSHLFVDPDTHRDLVRAFETPREFDVGLEGSVIGRIYGMAVVSRSIGRKWVPPTDRYVEYEESDHAWLRRMGFGRYAEIRYALFSNLRETWDASFTMREAGIWE